MPPYEVLLDVAALALRHAKDAAPDYHQLKLATILSDLEGMYGAVIANRELEKERGG